jgi:hypothetical protein
MTGLLQNVMEKIFLDSVPEKNKTAPEGAVLQAT